VTWHDREVRGRLRGIVSEQGAQYLRGRLLDIGCGLKPYEDALRPYVQEHVGLDHADSLFSLERVDIVASAYDIPVGSETFDSALATEVLEHLEEPVRALREWARVLRPDGYIVITTPFIWHLHDEPRDFFRYTPHGLRHVIEQSGLEVVKIELAGGFWTTFGQLLAYVLTTYDRGLARRFRIPRLLGTVSQRVGAKIEARTPRPAWASHVYAVARKPASSGHH
jgi:SAM-dependent methyltransferase